MNNLVFFLSKFLSHWRLQDSRRKEVTTVYSTLPFPPAQEHSSIYLQLCMWDYYHIFLIAPLVFTKLLLIKLPPYQITIWFIDYVRLICVCLLDGLILGFSCSNFDTRNQWIQTRINYQPCVTSELINQVC